MTKRLFDLLLAVPAVVLLAPLLSIIALVVKASDGGPVFFRQERIGYRGRSFSIWKFRSMRVGAERTGPSVTNSTDIRITWIGRILRKSKLDELPQLFNVLKGEMSFVGPRPEVQRYVSLYNDWQRKVLDLRPGITDLASIEFRNEESLLANADDMEKYYVEVCMPRKIELNLKYAEDASVISDIFIIFRTILSLFRTN